jgi:hypothetical protein
MPTGLSSVQRQPSLCRLTTIATIASCMMHLRDLAFGAVGPARPLGPPAARVTFARIDAGEGTLADLEAGEPAVAELPPSRTDIIGGYR